MTVQDLIDQLLKVKDKTKQVVYNCDHRIEEVLDDPANDQVILSDEIQPEWHGSDYKYEDE